MFRASLSRSEFEEHRGVGPPLYRSKSRPDMEDQAHEGLGEVVVSLGLRWRSEMQAQESM